MMLEETNPVTHSYNSYVPWWLRAPSILASRPLKQIFVRRGESVETKNINGCITIITLFLGAIKRANGLIGLKCNTIALQGICACTDLESNLKIIKGNMTSTRANSESCDEEPTLIEDTDDDDADDESENGTRIN
uniref:Uncharacterized protein n=1 Tax=Glossina pallidipes TaxID=7398 RepID=A0A1A9ZC75_GLOPL